MSREPADLSERLGQPILSLGDVGRTDAALEVASIGAFVHDIEDGSLWWSPTAYRLLGFEADRDVVTIGRFRDRIPAEDLARENARYAEQVAQRAPVMSTSFRYRLPSGEERWMANHLGLEYAPDGRPLRCFGIVVDVTERVLADQQRQASEARLTQLADAMPHLVWIFEGDGEVSYYNARLAMYWREEASSDGWEWQPRLHPDDIEPTLEAWTAAHGAGAFYSHEHRMRMADGSYRWHLSRAQPVPESDGRLRWYGTTTDIHELKLAEERQRLLVAELDHRVKNSLALVQAMAHQTFKGADVPAEPRRAFSDRLSAMAAAHDTLTRTRWDGALLAEIVRESVGGAGAAAARILAEGPEVKLNATRTVPVAMALHELCTNAVKYGALSAEAGMVQVSWRVDDAGVLHLEWLEQGGPQVAPPRRRGFGSLMIERAIAHQLGGQTQLDFHADGVRCRIRLPAEAGARP